jgi:predicted metal-dependent phosphoesterase TrpH
MHPCFIPLLVCLATPTAERILDAGYHHLGNDPVDNWPEASVEPEGTRLDIEFASQANAGEWLLYVHQRNVDESWTIELNGQAIGELDRSDDQIVALYPVAAGAVAEGTNRLSFYSSAPGDDITLGDVRLIEASRREHFNLKPVRVRVTERGHGGGPDGEPGAGRGLPVRLTIVDEHGDRPEIYSGESYHTAVRPGVVYTATGDAAFEVPAGRYEVHALRGNEWGHATAEIDLERDGQATVELSLAREVDTTGFVAADTHIHTLTFSGHGDSSVEERMATLAGEGVELAISTDHNHQLDYRPYQEKLGLNEYFTPVTGNEVTTQNGHFNAFPLTPGTDVPPYDVKDWVKLVEGIRAKGARVVILNHPRWPGLDTGPLGMFGFDRMTGELHSDLDAVTPAPRFTFDALELVNSTALQDDSRYILRDWFAIMNHGERITAVGSSDSHTVGDPVGQGRTYVRSSTDDPARIDVDEACEAFLRGDTTVSLGIFIDVVLGEGHVPGDLVSAPGKLPVAVRVATPSWVRPWQVELYVNAERVQSEPCEATLYEAYDRTLRFELPALAQDSWLVCFVHGAEVKDPCWRTPYTMAATNPIWLDVDGDGQFTGPRAIAQALVDRLEHDVPALREALLGFDIATRLQVLSIVRGRIGDNRETLDALAGDRGESGNLQLWRYLESLSNPDED